MVFSKKQLTEYLRAKLKVPLGKVFNENEIRSLEIKGLLVTVGDTCSFTMITNGISPDIVVYDFKNMRMPIEEGIRKVLEDFCKEKVVVNNPAGYITNELVEAVKKTLERKHGCIFVEGEEDLATLAVLMYAPDNAHVLYGQPKEGIVAIKVNNQIRELALSYYEQMESV